MSLTSNESSVLRVERNSALTALAAALLGAGASKMLPNDLGPWLLATGGILFLFVLFPSLGRVAQAPVRKYRSSRAIKVLQDARYMHEWRCPNGHVTPMVSKVDPAQGIMPEAGGPLRCPLCGVVGGGASQRIEPLNRPARSRYSPYRDP